MNLQAVVAFILLFLTGVFVGSLMERFRGKKLDETELFLAIDLIDVLARDEEHVRLLRDELYLWMESPEMVGVSKELKEVIDKVRGKV